MNEKNLQRFKRQLTEWQMNLAVQNGSVIENLREYDMQQPEEGDLAMEEGRLQFALRFRSRESRLMGKIRQALQDIEDGVYGICEVCGEEIGLRRLEVRPVARLCIRCKTEMEKRERLLR